MKFYFGRSEKKKTQKLTHQHELSDRCIQMIRHLMKNYRMMMMKILNVIKIMKNLKILQEEYLLADVHYIYFVLCFSHNMTHTHKIIRLR